jgi:hypothetical protein
MRKLKQNILILMQTFPKIFNPFWEYIYWPLFGKKTPDKGFSGSAQEVFTSIHGKNYWGSGESVSGPGSEIRFTENLRANLSTLISDIELKSMIDAPCGDCNWISKVNFPSGFSYTGGDIVEPLINENRGSVSFLSQSVVPNFTVFDIRLDELPDVDLWLCREVFFHMPNKDILMALKNFKKSKIKYLLTTNFYFCPENTDSKSGGFRPINLRIEPFGLPKPLASYSDFVIPHAPRYLELWHRDQLESIVF